MKYKMMVLTLILLMVGCQKKVEKKSTTIPEPVNIEFTLIGMGNLLGNGSEGIEAGSLWITGQSEWNDLIEKMNTLYAVSDTFIESDIDFTTFDVIASFDIVRPHTGYVVQVDKITDDSNNRIVQVALRVNNNGFEVPSQPYYLIKMSKSGKTVMFQ
ncbi:hypothetical protein [Flavobacterium sp. JP2137]|uniref:hypothetical protein n=1 Tax=Flavobacterium sp. JP2137 TaxID=3414510 RepID=UPI003D2FF3FC